jgi:hypothetical protein
VVSLNEKTFSLSLQLQMRGLNHVLSVIYTEGMPLDELQIAVATAVQQELQRSIQNLDPIAARNVMDFLQGVDYTLTQEYNKEIHTGRSM